MTFTIITHVPHIKQGNQYFAYGPYVREMNLWLKYVDEVVVVAPVVKDTPEAIDLSYKHENIKVVPVPSFSLTSVKNVCLTVFRLPKIIKTVYAEMKRADHIHLRCPGNMGVLGCLLQIVFPKTPKTAKYAGNWDVKSKQPLSYRLQRFILKNTVLTKNMQVLVYGKWPNQSKNIKPFFTATYSETEKEMVNKRAYSAKLNFVYVGTLNSGKQVPWAVKFVEQLKEKGQDVSLDIYGNGPERVFVNLYVNGKDLQDTIILHGNQPKETVKTALQQAHFLILPSKSEGWPKVVAEAMFWGCIPVATPVSCVPWMLGYGGRGFLIEKQDPVKEANKFLIQIQKKPLDKIASEGVKWSRQYTLERFEEEIGKLIDSPITKLMN